MPDPSEPTPSTQKLIALRAEIDHLQTDQAVARNLEANGIRVYDLETVHLTSVEPQKIEGEYQFTGGIVAPGPIELGVREETDPTKNFVRLKGKDVEIDSENIAIHGATTIDGNGHGDHALTVTGNTTLHNALMVEGAAMFDSTLSVDGSTTLDGTLTATGAVTLADTGVITSVEGPLDVKEGVTFDSTLSVDGNTTLDGTLTVEEAVNINHTLTANAIRSGDIQDLDGNEYVRSSGSGGVVTLQNLDVTGDTQVHGDLRVDQTLRSRAIMSDSIVDSNGNMYLRSGVSGASSDELSKRLRSEHRIYVSKHGRDTNDGSSPDQGVLSIRRACELAERRPATTIYVESGYYYEKTPIFVDSTVSIIGDSLRTVFLHSRALEVGPQTRARALLKGISRNIVTPGSRFEENAITNPGGFHDTANVWKTNRAFLQEQVLQWVEENYPGLLEAERKDLCYRDVGFLVDAVEYDLRYGGFTSSLESAKKYVDGSKSVLFPGQNQSSTIEPTAYAVSYLITLVDAATTSTFAFTDPLESGENAMVDLLNKFHEQVTNPETQTPISVINTGGYTSLVNILRRNRLFIQAKLIDILSLDPLATMIRFREYGNLVDAVANDLETGGTSHIVANAEIFYQNGIEPFNSIEKAEVETLLKDLIKDVDRGQPRLNRENVSEGARAVINGWIDYLKGDGNIPVMSESYVQDAHLLYANRHFLRAEMNAEFPVAPNADPIGPVITIAVDTMVEDLHHGTGDKLVSRKNNGYFSTLTSPQLDRLNTLIQTVLQQDVIMPLQQMDVAQVWLHTPFRLLSIVESLVTGTVNRISIPSRGYSDIAVQNPGGFANAGDAIRQNKMFVVAETMAWIDSKPEFGDFINEFGSMKYRAQIQTFVDAITQDVMHGGFSRVLSFATLHQRLILELANPNDAGIQSARILESVIPILKSVVQNQEYTRSISVSNPGVAQVFRSSFSLSDDPLYYPNEDPDYNRTDFFHVMEKTYLFGLRFKDLQAPGYCVAFPTSLVKPKVDYSDRGSVIPIDVNTWGDIADPQTIRFPVVFSYDYRSEVGPNFPSTAQENPGEFLDAALELENNLETLRSAVMHYVDNVSQIFSPSVNPDPLRDQKRVLCKRDVGLLVDAVVSDLRSGGYMASARAVVAYYIHAKSILPANTIDPTVQSVAILRDETNDLLNAMGNQTSAQTRAEALWNGIITSLEDPTDPNTGELTWVPEVLVDMPSHPQGTRIRAIQVVNGGTNYNPNQPPTVTINHRASDTGALIHMDGLDEATATAVVSQAGTVTQIIVDHPGRGYDQMIEVVISQPDGGITAQAEALREFDICELEVKELDDHGRIQLGYKFRNGIPMRGSGYEETPTISIQPPRSKRPFVSASPYVQNCSNMSGPWDQTGEKVPVFHPLPYNVNDIYNAANGRDKGKGIRMVDEEGSGGGIRIDGNIPIHNSPLRSFVVDAFTQVNQGGVGFLLINRAYAQFVSTFGTFCSTHFKALGGSFANASNSVTDFGREGILARGFARRPYLRSRAVAPIIADASPNQQVFPLGGGAFLQGEGYFSEILNVSVNFNPGDGYGSGTEITVEIDPPNPVPGRRTATVTGFEPALTDQEDLGGGRILMRLRAGSAIEDGRLRQLTVARDADGLSGAGYRSPPTVTINHVGNPPTEPASTQSALTGVASFTVEIDEGSSLVPQFMSMALVGGQFCLVNDVIPVLDENENVVPNKFVIRTTPAPNYVLLNDTIEFFQVSYITTSSHAMEYCGSGITYNALPEFGGIPDRSKEVVEVAPGRVFYTKSDQLGNFDAGDAFRVDQLTGSITIDARNLDLSSINSLGPFVRDGRRVGVRVQEISNDSNMRSSLQIPDSETVPTQTAVVNYLAPRAVPPVGPQNEQHVLVARPNRPGVQRYAWEQLSAADLGLERAEIITDVSQGLYVEGEANVYGNLYADHMQITDPSSDVPLRTGGLTMQVGDNGNTLVIRYKHADGDVRTKTLNWD